MDTLGCQEPIPECPGLQVWKQPGQERKLPKKKKKHTLTLTLMSSVTKWEESSPAKGNICKYWRKTHREEIFILFALDEILYLCRRFEFFSFFNLRLKPIVGTFYANVALDVHFSISCSKTKSHIYPFWPLNLQIPPPPWAAQSLSNKKLLSVWGWSFGGAPQCLLGGSNWDVGVCLCKADTCGFVSIP